MALATDYRPTTLTEFEGNSTLKAALKSKLSLAPDKRPHVYLFVGAKGTGKTTLARITASYLKCSDREFTEIDATDDSGGVTAIRELKRTVRYPPMVGDVRVWFIDECANLTSKGQEALLKMLEEPPKYAYFILATTDPQKLTKTLKDRCITFEVQPLSTKEMEEFISGIAEAEGVDLPDKVIKKIVQDSNGHPRAALQMLERIIDLPAKDMEKAVEQAAEVETQVIDLCRAMLKPKASWKEICPLIKTLTGEPESNRHAVRGYCSAILLSGQDNAKAALILEMFKDKYMDKNDFTLAAYQVFMG